eukprot:259989_1
MIVLAPHKQLTMKDNRRLNIFHLALESNLQYASSLNKQLHELQIQLLCNLEKQRLLKSRQQIKTWESYSSRRRCALMRRLKFFESPFHMYFIKKTPNVKGNEYSIIEPINNIDTNYWLNKSKIIAHKTKGFQEYVPIFHLSKNISRIEKNIIITSVRCEYIEKSKKK